jgi:hypothetical protein
MHEQSMPTTHPKKLVIIGAGFSGTLTAGFPAHLEHLPSTAFAQLRDEGYLQADPPNQQCGPPRSAPASRIMRAIHSPRPETQ